MKHGVSQAQTTWGNDRGHQKTPLLFTTLFACCKKSRNLYPLEKPQAGQIAPPPKNYRNLCILVIIINVNALSILVKY